MERPQQYRFHQGEKRYRFHRMSMTHVFQAYVIL